MATAGMLADNPGVDYHEELAVSTCQITMILNLAANSLRTNYFIKQLCVVLSKTALQRMPQSSYVHTCHDKVSIDIAATLSTWYWWCLSPIAIINTCIIATTCKTRPAMNHTNTSPQGKSLIHVLYYTGETEMSMCVLVFKEEITTLPYQVFFMRPKVP